MERNVDATDRLLARLAVRLTELAGWRDRESLAIPEGRFRSQAESGWRTLLPGERWPERGCPVFFRFECRVPESWAGRPVHGRFDFGGEALLSANGNPVGGLTPLHTEHVLLPAAGGGETLVVEAEVVPHGPFGAPNPEPRFREARLLVPDVGVRSLHDDLAAALDAAVYLSGTGRKEVAARIGDAVQTAFAQVRLPRSQPEAYLARLAGDAARGGSVAHGGSAANAEHSESLAAIWEAWRFDAPPAPLPEEVEAEVEGVRRRLAADLASVRDLYPPEGCVWLTGHAHIDLAWLWPLEETRRKVLRTFHTVLSLMEMYPGFHFNQSSAQVYAWAERDDPELFEKIRRKVSQGRWEIIGGMWVEPDGNLPAGESWVRQILFGQRYFESRFGRRPTVAWLPDSFGFTGNLPQLLRSGGLPFFFTQKLTWNEVNAFPHDLYHWEGIDGSRVLAHSFCNPPRGYNGRIDPHDAGSTWRNFRGKRFHDATLLAVGHGDGGGGPTSEMLERFDRLKDFPGLPRLQMSAVEEFFRRIPAGNLPVWVGEQYLEFHRGTYTSQALIKALHRRLERAVFEAEAAATLAFAFEKHPYPQGDLRGVWETLLLNEFHDILPGSSIRSVNEAAVGQLRSALEGAEGLRRNALGRFGQEPGPPGKGLAVWNLDLEPRPLLVEIPGIAGGRAQTADGRDLQVQKTEDGLLIDGDVPVPGLSPLFVRVAPGGPVPAASSALQAADRRLENEYLKIEVSGAGYVESIYDKRFGREVLAGPGNRLWVYTDIPRRFDAWDIDESYVTEGAELRAAAELELVESGPLRAAIRVRYRHAGDEITQTYKLEKASCRLDCVTHVRWRSRRTLLRALFPVNVRTHEAWAETAFGAVPRPTHRNTPWDQAKFEVPAHRWIDLSEAGYGVSLLSDSKYGYSAEGNVLGISLLRSPIYPDPYADAHEHRFTYALYPHPGDWRTGGTLAAARELNAPLTVLPSRGADRQFSPLVSIADGPLQLAALKKAEDSDEVIVRLFEPHGSRGQTSLRSALPLRSARLVNLLEEDLCELPVEGSTTVRLTFTPFQVISIKLMISG